MIGFHHLLGLHSIVILIQFSSGTQNGVFNLMLQRDSDIRQNRARDVQKFLSVNVNPCNDFFEFACGKWSGHSEKVMENAENDLKSEIDADLKAYLDEPARVDEISIIRISKEFYKSCLICQRNGYDQQLFFSALIKSNKGFPAVPASNWLVHHHNYNWVEVVAKLHKNYGLNILIGVKVDINLANIQENSIYLSPPSLLIPPAFCNKESTERLTISDDAYKRIQRDIEENLILWLAISKEDSKKIAADIVTFEFELCNSLNESLAYPIDAHNIHKRLNYERKNVNELSHMFGGRINFDEYMKFAFGSAIYKPVYLMTPIFFRHLIRLTEKTAKEVLANYIIYRMLFSFAYPFTDHPNNRADFCLKQVKKYLPSALGELYQRYYSSESTKTDILSLFNQIKNEFQTILQSDWIGERTRRIGLKKLNQIILFFPMNESLTLRKPELDKSNYWTNLIIIMGHVQELQLKKLNEESYTKPIDEIYAYEPRIQYRAIQNRVDIGWGLLRPPLYHNKYGYSMLFSTIGQMLSQQIANAFSDTYWSLNIFGTDNWDSLTEQSYKNRSQCFKKQLGNYLNNDQRFFQNDLELQTLISRSTSIIVAFKAYLNWLHFRNPNNDFTILNKETLPNLNFSNTQLFFITFAQTLCLNLKRNSTNIYIYSARQLHSLERYSVNGPLRNFNEFTHEFGCKIGAPMNPAHKCVIF